MTVNEMIKKLQSYQKAKYGDLPVKIEGVNDRDDIHSINMVVDDNNAVYIEPQNTHDIVCGLKKYTGEKHGYWIDKTTWFGGIGKCKYECSNCGYTIDYDPKSRGDKRGGNYCDDCGAKMDVGE